MPLPKFIQISCLTSYPAVLLNRDDSGLAKRIQFGSAVRTRVSSQCLKRHWRLADDEYALTKAGEGLRLAVRSRELLPRRIGRELEKDFSSDVVNEVISKFYTMLIGGKNDESDDEETEEPGKKESKPVVVLGEPELAYLLEEARKICAEANDDKRRAGELLKDFFSKKNKAGKENLERFIHLPCGAGVDGAMFGRFISGQPEAKVTSAVHVAHALTVHKETSETDYFSVVDELTKDENTGSGHLGAAELNSSLFYNYVVVDVPQLMANLGAGKREDWLKNDRDVAARLTRHLIHLVSKVTPGAKLGSTAPYAHAELVLVEAGERQPRTLANAFLNPVPLSGSLLDKAAGALNEYVTSMDDMYGKGEDRWLACRIKEASIPGAERMSLPALAEAVEKAIREAR